MGRGLLAVVCAAGCGRMGFDVVADAPSVTTTDASTVAAACPERSAITGTTYWVATTGSDTNDGSQAAPVATVSRAVALADAGGTIVVLPGVYSAEPNGEISVSSTVPLRLLSQERYRAVIPRLTCLSCENLTVEGFEVTGSTLPSLQINGATGVTLADNLVHDSGSAGIRITSFSSAIEIIGNSVYDTTASSIHVNEASDVLIHGNVLFDAATTPNGLARIWLEAATSATVSGNVVFRVRGDYATYGLISIRQTTKTVFENNIVAASPETIDAYAAIGFDQASGEATFRHNTFVGPLPGTAFGLGVPSVAAGSTYMFVNNVWASAGTTQPFTTGTAPVGTFALRHNLYWNAPNGPFAPGGTPNPGDDPESIVADPGVAFAIPLPPVWSATTREFTGGAKTICDAHTGLGAALATVPATSAAARAADPAQSPTTDILGRARPSPATLGAFEPQ